MSKSYWLLKTEPETYHFNQMVQDKKTNWNGVRNFQARNYLRSIQVGDLALIYHSGDERAVVGIAEVIKAGYPDLDPKKPGDWVQVDLKPVKSFPAPVQLAEIKQTPALADMPLLKQSRLSVMPITQKNFELLLKMGKVTK
jgi:predicted RNA-binding protein with PUA-like domain